MTVGEMIEKLRSFNQNLIVVYDDEGYGRTLVENIQLASTQYDDTIVGPFVELDGWHRLRDTVNQSGDE